ncbi:MAG: T9SS type A sorting domain-containing protein [Ignavibacteriae bacterium]|nr:T9SS type A sorting domain-containing protein [Ignavibacteriota bacterium]
MKKVLILLIVGINIWAQAGEWTFYTAEYKDLPNHMVNAIAIDSLGNKWFGTNNGIGIFNGNKWIQFNKNNSVLPDSVITSIIVDSNNVKWIATRLGGLVRYDNNVWTIFDTIKSIIPDVRISSLTIDQNNNLWLSTYSGLVKFDGSNWKVFDKSNSNLISERFYKIRFDENGILWGVGSEGMLIKYDGSTFTNFNNFKDAQDRAFNFIDFDIDKNGYLWIGTDGNGIVKFKDSIWTVLEYELDDVRNYISVVGIDKNNNKWFGSYYYDGIMKFDEVKWTFYDERNSKIPSTEIVEIAFDNDTIWFSAKLLGAVKFYEDKFETFGASYGLPSNSVRDVAVDSNHVKWIATSEGLAKFSNNKWTVYNNSNSPLPSSKLEVVRVDENNNKWIGTENGDLVKFNDTEWTIFSSQTTKMPNSLIMDIGIDSDTIWIATKDSGLVKFHDSQIKTFNISNSGISNNFVKSVDIDNQGEKWVVLGSGIAKFNGFSWTHFNQTNSGLPSNNFDVLRIGKDYQKLIGSSYNGLIIYNDNTWINYDVINSEIPDNTISAVGVDHQGRIWVGSAWFKGISLFENGSWYNFNEGNYLTISGGIDGISADNFAFDNENNLWIATGSFGLAVFNYGNVSNIDEIENSKIVNHSFQLMQNYPNPFNPSTTIKYAIPSLANDNLRTVLLKVYDILGNEVTTLVNEIKSPGNYEVQFDASNFSNGVYYYKLSSGNFVQVKKMMLLK